jgi:hypothetical protein
LTFQVSCVNQNFSGSKSSSNGKISILQKHRQIIFPQLAYHGSNHSSTNASSDVITQCLPKKYNWYPNLKIESPVKTRKAESPAPKTVKSFFKFSTVIVRNDPMTPQSSVTNQAFTRKAEK